VAIVIIPTITVATIGRTLVKPRASAISIRRRTADLGSIQRKSEIDLKMSIRDDSIIIRDTIVILKTDFDNILSLVKVLTKKVFKLLKPLFLI
jgi:hypothetical protein